MIKRQRVVLCGMGDPVCVEGKPNYPYPPCREIICRDVYEWLNEQVGQIESECMSPRVAVLTCDDYICLKNQFYDPEKECKNGITYAERKFLIKIIQSEVAESSHVY